ncbi:MAG TPA: heme peroxidase family protein [Thermoanaerobaculia bacterium]|jgi:hypothetical protein
MSDETRVAAAIEPTAPGESNIRSFQNRGAEMRFHGAGELRGLNVPRSWYFDSGRFGRLFPMLPPFHADPGALLELGKAGGPMDGGLTAPDNPSGLPVGFTFLGQFIDHDITFDPTSSLERQVDPEAVANFRTPTLELDNVYGSGPGASPHLYDRRNRNKLLIGDGTTTHDVPRNAQAVALIGDPRNDENLIVSQIHLAFLRFHNAVVDDVATTPVPGRSTFEEAQRRVRWHYQWMIVHEFLPHIVGKKMVEDVLKNGRKFYDWRHEPFMPVEFSVAAYRFGHSQVRPGYTLRPGKQFPIFVADPPPPDQPRKDLSGSRPIAADETIEQALFFKLQGPPPASKAIDTKLSSPLLNLPLFGLPDKHPERSLATRNLLRHLTFGLPTGQAVAQAMSETPLTPDDLKAVRDLGFDQETPLWYYILAEAELEEKGAHLGAVGGRIVAEVLIGLIQGDRMSYLRQNPKWKPFLGKDGDFTMADLFALIGA